MAVTTVSSLNSLYNVLFEETWYVARQAAMMPNLVFRFQDGGLGAQARKVGEWGSITVNQVAEGVDAAGASTFGKTLGATLTPSDAVGVAILTDDMVNTDQENTVAALSFEMGNAIATSVDESIVDLFPSFSTDKGTGAGQTATLASASAAISILINNKASGPFNFVLHPYQWHDIFKELGMPAATYSFLGDVANEALREYSVGQFVGARWFINSNIDVDGSDDAVGAVFSPRAIGYDPRGEPKYETERDASLRATEYVVVHKYAVGILKNTWGVKLTSDASEPS